MNMNEIKDMIDEQSIDDVKLTPADEAAIFLEALQDACDSAEEYQTLVMENATELALYGLIPDADIANEAVKKIVYKQTKEMNLNREQSKAALRLAKNANSPEWKKYHKARTKMLEEKENIFKKFGSKAKTEAKKIISNARRKASSIPSVTGKTITEKMDKKINEMSSK